MQTIKSSSTSCFKYLAIINSARKTNALVIVDLFVAGSCLCTRNNLIKAKAISPSTLFFLKNFFSKTYTSKAATGVALSKKQSLKLLEYVQENVLEPLFNKAAGLQDCCKTYLLYSHLKFYFSLGKTLRNIINFP